MDDLSLEEAQELMVGLGALVNRQAEALQMASYIPMFREQAEKYDARRKRISEIWGVLKEFKPGGQS
jgi:hypothetical protein